MRHLKFTSCISRINKSGILWEYCRDEPALNNGVIFDITANNTFTYSFKKKEKITGDDFGELLKCL